MKSSVLLFGIALVVTGCADLRQTPSFHATVREEDAPVSLCDIARNERVYTGRDFVLKAHFQIARHGSYLHDNSCPSAIYALDLPFNSAQRPTDPQLVALDDEIRRVIPTSGGDYELNFEGTLLSKDQESHLYGQGMRVIRMTRLLKFE